VIQSYAMRHNLNDVAIEDLIKSYNCLAGEPAHTSLTRYFPVIVACKFIFTAVPVALIHIGEKSDFKVRIPHTERYRALNVVKCPIELRKKDCVISSMNDGNFFIVLPLTPQLKCFLETQSR